jgi:hypothetical protein
VQIIDVITSTTTYSIARCSRRDNVNNLHYLCLSSASHFFMKTEFLLPQSHKLVICPYSDPDQHNLCPPLHFLKIHFNIILPSRPVSSTWSISSRFSHPNPICALSTQAQSKAYICPSFPHNQLTYHYCTHYYVK